MSGWSVCFTSNENLVCLYVALALYYHRVASKDSLIRSCTCLSRSNRSSSYYSKAFMNCAAYQCNPPISISLDSICSKECNSSFKFTDYVLISLFLSPGASASSICYHDDQTVMRLAKDGDIFGHVRARQRQQAGRAEACRSR